MAVSHLTSVIEAINFGTTAYLSCGISDLGEQTTENRVQTTVYRAAGVSNMYTRVTTNSVNGTSTLRFRINNGDGNESLSIGSSTTGEFLDLTNIDNVAANDEIAHQLVTGGSSGAITLLGITETFNSPEQMEIMGNTGLAFATASSTVFQNLVGVGTNAAVEARAQYPFKYACTVDKLFVFIQANTRASSATTYTIRKESADTSLTVSVGASSTGVFEDTSNTVSVAADERVNYELTTGTGVGTITSRVQTVEVRNTAGLWFTGCQSIGTAQSLNTTRYITIGGLLSVSTTDVTLAPYYSSIFKNLIFGVAINTTSTAATTVTFRRNGSDTVLTTSVPAGTTGVFQDTTNKVRVNKGDDLNTKVVVAAGGTGSITYVFANYVGQIITQGIIGQGVVPFRR